MAGDGSGSTPVTLVVTETHTVVPPPTTAPPAPHGQLPFTGFAVVAAVLIAVLLLAVGSVFLLVGRRPRPTPTPRSA